MIGHNADIAWGFTNLGPDVTDLFLEQIDGDDRYVARRRDGAAASSAPRRSRSRGEDDVDDHACARRCTARSSPTSSTTFATVGANAPADEPA